MTKICNQCHLLSYTNLLLLYIVSFGPLLLHLKHACYFSHHSYFLFIDADNGNRKKIVGFVIAFICLGVFVLTFAVSSNLFRLVVSLVADISFL